MSNVIGTWSTDTKLKRIGSPQRMRLSAGLFIITALGGRGLLLDNGGEVREVAESTARKLCRKQKIRLRVIDGATLYPFSFGR